MDHDFRKKSQRNFNLLCFVTILVLIFALQAYILIKGVPIFNIDQNPSSIKCIILLMLSTLYFARLMYSNFFIVKRLTPWEEIISVAIYLFVMLTLVAFLGVWTRQNFSPVEYFVGLVMVGIGSFFTSYSEIQRRDYKADPNNKGKLYTDGLFRWTRHPNYFGDSMLFCGWTYLSGSWIFCAINTVIMVSIFIFMHIPGLEKYMKEKYDAQWKHYERTTKAKLIPFLY